MQTPSSSAVWNRRHVVLFWTLLAIAPVSFMLAQVIGASRNIPFWDDYDSTLGFVLQLDSGLSGRELAARLFAIDSEHRTVTSRIILAALYGLTGGVNFNVISAIGNLALLGLCGMLVWSMTTSERRLRLAALLALGLFHLGHYETFFWGGASIDHHLVLFFAGGVIVALARGGRLGCGVAAAFAGLATFTLAHGCLVWLIGGGMLASACRWRALAGWAVVAALVLAVFFYDFLIYPAHRIRDFSPAGLLRLGEFWLTLLGGGLTLGAERSAPAFGLVLLAMLGWLGARGSWRREPVLMPMAVFAIAALGLIAVGRFEVAAGQIQSRYLVVSSLAWTLAVFMLLETWTPPARPFRLLGWCLPGLVAFNIAANLRSAGDAATFLWSREYPALRLVQYGEEGHAGPFRLHPRQDTAERVLTAAAERGIYELPAFCYPATTPQPEANEGMVTYVTDLTADESAVGFEGWALLPARESKRGQIYVLLQSAKSRHAFSTVSVDRLDVAKAFKEPRWRYGGYSFVIDREQLPDEDFQIGLIISDGYRAQFKMTDKWLKLGVPPPAQHTSAEPAALEPGSTAQVAKPVANKTRPRKGVRQVYGQIRLNAKRPR